MRIAISWLRIAALTSMALTPVGGASAVTLGRPVPVQPPPMQEEPIPVPLPPIQVEPAPPIKPPPTPEQCLQRFQRRVAECNAKFPCGWSAVYECYVNLGLCVDAAEEIYDDCIARALPVLNQ